MFMIDELGMLAQGVMHFLTPMSLFNIAWATLLGIVIGMLPGLTATMGVALLVTLTYGMPGDQAILTLICMYVGAIYGGSRSAILLNIPGTPASAATSLDGYPLAQQGKAGYAMGLATTSSAIGTIVGIFFLAILAPALAEFAFNFGSYEFFWLAVFGVVISGRLTGANDPLKGYIAGMLGLLVAMVGMESLHAFRRFEFGIPSLAGGIDIIPAMVGAFGFAEILTVMRRKLSAQVITSQGRTIPYFKDVWDYRRTAIRSGIIGTLVGIIPGVGEDIGSWSSYAAARRASKE
ncbi:MAG: tripartite tricarboxylate transporter permease, partial [Natronospirillum sp.]